MAMILFLILNILHLVYNVLNDTLKNTVASRYLKPQLI